MLKEVSKNVGGQRGAPQGGGGFLFSGGGKNFFSPRFSPKTRGLPKTKVLVFLREYFFLATYLKEFKIINIFQPKIRFLKLGGPIYFHYFPKGGSKFPNFLKTLFLSGVFPIFYLFFLGINLKNTPGVFFYALFSPKKNLPPPPNFCQHFLRGKVG